MKTRYHCFGLCILVLTLLGACGYSNRKPDVSLAGAQSTGLQRIFIPVADNLTTRPGLEVALTNALRETLSGVKGLEVVNTPDTADYFLLGSVTAYARRHGVSLVTGTASTAAAGGLGANQSSASEITISMAVKMKLVEKVANTAELRRLLWARDFSQDGTFEASQRFIEAAGASSAPHINESRETVQVQILSVNMARQVLDQVVQDF